MEITSDWKPGSVKKSVGFSVKRHSAVLFKCDICSNTLFAIGWAKKNRKRGGLKIQAT